MNEDRIERAIHAATSKMISVGQMSKTGIKNQKHALLNAMYDVRVQLGQIMEKIDASK